MSLVQTLISEFKASEIHAKKALGQNFLFSKEWLRKIAEAAQPQRFETVVEIGSGPGNLTLALCEAGAKRVHALEIDPRCFSFFQDFLQRNPDVPVTLAQGDAMECAWWTLGDMPRLLVANLPYCVSVPIFLSGLQHGVEMVCMVQKEVADRIVAKSNTKDYGRLAVMAQTYSDVSVLMTLPPGAFSPAPQVDSSVVRAVPKPSVAAWKRMEHVVKTAFANRRKMLRQTLRPLWPNVDDQLKTLDIDPARRAETLTVEEFVRLSCV